MKPKWLYFVCLEISVQNYVHLNFILLIDQYHQQGHLFILPPKRAPVGPCKSRHNFQDLYLRKIKPLVSVPSELSFAEKLFRRGVPERAVTWQRSVANFLGSFWWLVNREKKDLQILETDSHLTNKDILNIGAAGPQGWWFHYGVRLAMLRRFLKPIPTWSRVESGRLGIARPRRDPPLIGVLIGVLIVFDASANRRSLADWGTRHVRTRWSKSPAARHLPRPRRLQHSHPAVVVHIHPVP